MAVNISAWSIRQPLPPIVLALAMIFMGLMAFSKLPVTRMPNVDAPVISVTVVQFGSSPTELETQVTKLIEDAVSSVAGAHHINSLITDGISNTDDHLPPRSRYRPRHQRREGRDRARARGSAARHR